MGAIGLGLGYNFYKNRMYDQAVQMFRKSLIRHYNAPATHYYLARTYQKKNNKIQAKEHFREAMRLVPEKHIKLRIQNIIDELK